MTRETALQLAYLAAAVAFILCLKGLSSPRTARRGNLIGVLGMLLAVGVTLADERIRGYAGIAAGVAVGTVVGVPAARRVRMTAVPQMVALFNGVGGAAAALVALVEVLNRPLDEQPWGVALAALFTALVGAATFSGSVVTFAKLQELMTGRPITYPAARVVNPLLVLAALGACAGAWATGSVAALVLVVVLGGVLGVALVLPVGGADVPVVISLLNSFSGLTVATSGFTLDNTLLIVAGTLVGASGTLLTRIMSKAMGRPLRNILFGALSGGSSAGSTAEVAGGAVRSGSAEDVAILLAYARKVVVVPGYGLAVAQAQHTIRELADLLERRGVSVSYAIHPVAGRMPGHMNVLLAEANVPYDQLREMAPANSDLGSTDVALVVGANDVVNPAARDVPGSPIYGMPILEVDRAANVVFLKRSMRPGFAGIDNALLYDAKTTLLFGDAKESLTGVVAAVKAL